MTKLILSIARLWKYKKVDAITLKNQVLHYYSGEGAFRSGGKVSTARDYWLAIPTTPHTTIVKNFALRIHELVAHAAGVEGVFNVMGATKTKYRNHMTVTHLKMISQIELELKAEDAACEDAKGEEITTIDYEDESNTGIFSGVDDLQEFEDGVFARHDSHEETDIDVHEDGFIDCLFDLNVFGHTPDAHTSQAEDDGNISEGDSWDENDLCG
ncbi:uncharacterized protein MELLADRAFT_55137 [Melampsora larici-populina 98AG31]|uniref:Uncharacterized protein n=1 Tax=Melampsora larici-populina (strain 98AG31 / pathotype 3-4-7) TaxID=747676 RepID=F4RBG2_MELLP|nr:uncharacterized protein MELLADRAFT_55137 [Melampsora larici-populina 98AG31]EGG10366.1 hypothetical protein MELLADRAFT_55137 [Melampsora larici-populina 98AG31]